MTLDAITLSVIQAALQQTCDEMDLTYSRAAFSPVIADTDLRQIHKTQAANFSFFKSLARGLQHRYAIVAQKPAG